VGAVTSRKTRPEGRSGTGAPCGTISALGDRAPLLLEPRQGQLEGGNKLTRFPLQAGIPDRTGVWRLEGDEGWVWPLQCRHSSRSH
jgi:hypothetical protein